MILDTFLFLSGPHYFCYHTHLCMKYSLDISNFLEEILVFSILLFSSVSLRCSFTKAFLSFLAILWNPAFSLEYLSFAPLPLAFLPFSATYKCRAFSEHFALIHFSFGGLGHYLLYNVTNLCP